MNNIKKLIYENLCVGYRFLSYIYKTIHNSSFQICFDVFKKSFFYANAKIIIVVIFQAFIATSSFAASSFLNTPRILRIKLDLVSGSKEAEITTSNSIIDIFDKAKQSTLFSGKATKLQIEAKPEGALLFTVNEKTFIASRTVTISSKSPRSATISLSALHRNTKKYRGKLEVRSSSNKLYWVNVVDMEDYLQSVVPSEISPIAPKAAIEAQSIAARTYAVRNINRHIGSFDCNLCDTTHCQAYEGVAKETRNSNAAVKDTEGQILLFKEDPANTVYHSNCGGYIVSSQAQWGGRQIPYLIGHFDGQFDGEKVGKSFCEYGNYFLKHRKAPSSLPKKSKRLVIGVAKFEVKRKKTHDNFGHRVGMCQDGAIGMALIGYSCSNILGFYYPTTTIETLKYASKARHISKKYAPTPIAGMLKSNEKGQKLAALPNVSKNKLSETAIKDAKNNKETVNKLENTNNNENQKVQDIATIAALDKDNQNSINVTNEINDSLNTNIANSSISLDKPSIQNTNSHFLVIGKNSNDEPITITVDTDDIETEESEFETDNDNEIDNLDDLPIQDEQEEIKIDVEIAENNIEDDSIDPEIAHLIKEEKTQILQQNELPNNDFQGTTASNSPVIEKKIDLPTEAVIDNKKSEEKERIELASKQINSIVEQTELEKTNLIEKPTVVSIKEEKSIKKETNMKQIEIQSVKTLSVLEKPNSYKLKSIITDINNSKPNTTYLSIKKMFWVPVPPTIMVSKLDGSK